MFSTKKVVLGLGVLLLLAGGFVVSNRQTGVKIAGQLNAELGADNVIDGFYDMRIVTYDAASGGFLQVRDFADVTVEGGVYVVDYDLDSSVESDKIYYQLCRSGRASSQPDGFNAQNLPVRCESLAQEDSSLPVVECPKTLVVDRQGIFGNATSYATPDCIEDETTIAAVDFAGSNTEKQSVKAIFGERGPEGPKGEKGDTGEPGTNGLNGAAGANGKDGAQGIAGDPATDDQTLSVGGLSILSITGGNSVSLAGLLDNTDVLADLACGIGQVPQWNGSAWACANTAADTDDQTLSWNGGTSVLTIVDGNTVNLGSLLDNTDSQDISLSGNTLSLTGDGTTVNLAAYLDNTDNQNLFLAIDTPNGTDPVADTQTDTLAFTDGAGITITGNGTTDTITIAATLGVAIDSSEITDGTIAFADIATNGCANNEIFKFNGSAWFCGTDNDTAVSEATVEAFIFDGDNVGTLSSGTLALSSLSYTGTLGDTNIADALTISSSGSVADGALSANVSLLGSSVDSSEITNGTVTGTDLASATILFSNIAQNGCTNNQIMKWNGSAWACAADVDTDTDAQNLFATLNADNGTDPVADSATDTLNLVSGSGVTITGDSSTDTLTIAATLGTAITSSEIVDGEIVAADIADSTITNAKLANSSLTVSAGTGLTGGGSVSLGGTVTLNLANDFGASIDTGEITNGTITATDVAGNVFIEIGRTTTQTDSTTNSTIFVNKTGLSGNLLQLQAAAVNEFIIGFDGTIDTASVDSVSIVDGSVSNTDLANSSLTVTAGTGLTNGGAISLGGTATLNIGAGNGITVNADDVAVQVAASADGLSATTSTGSGLEVLGSGLTLIQGCSNNQILKWNETTDVWACAADTDTDADAQTLSLVTDTLSISGGNSVSLAGYLDNTDSQNLFLTVNADNGTDPVADGATDTLNFVSGTGVTITGDSSTDSLTIASVLGTSIDSSEITDGTVSNTDLANSSLTVSAGTGLTGGGAVSLGGTVTLNLANDFGASIDSGEITNGTITATDVAGNVFIEIGRSAAQTDGTTDSTIFVNKTGVSGNLMQLQASAVNEFVIGFDGTIDTASVDSTSIVDGTVSNTDLANSSVTVTAGTGLTNGGAISLGGAATLNIGAGNGITVNADDIAVRVAASADGLSATTSSGSGLEVLATGVALLQGCADNQVLKWNETTDVWACGNDIDTDAQNLFLTFNADNGTDPVADGVTDTLNFASGAGVTITGDSSTDTLTIAAVLGATIDSSAEIVDGIIANADLVNSGVTIVAGSGLITGGAVSLGGTVTLDVGAGTAITVNGNDIAVTVDGINYTELTDTLSLDATTTTTLGANNLVTNLDSTGDILFQDGASTFLTLSDTGAYDYTLDATDNPGYTITNAGTSDVNTNLTGTGDFSVQDGGTTVLTVLDNGTFQFRNSTDNASSFLIEDSSALDIFEIDTVANAVRIGELVDDAADVLLVLDGVASADPTGIAGGMYYNTTDSRFRCYENGAWSDCLAGYGRNITIKEGLSTASAAATNLAAATLNCVSDPSLRIMTNLKGMTRIRFMGRFGGTVVAATTMRIQYNTSANPAIATGDAGWTTLDTSAGSHTANTMFYTAEATIPVAARINPIQIRACIFGGDSAADPTITAVQLNVYP